MNKTLTLTASEYLEQAKALIEKGWCTGSFAIDKDGRAVPIQSDDADCFCSVGAIRKIFYENNNVFDNNNTVDSSYHEALATLARNVSERDWLNPSDAIAGWNDEPQQTKSSIIAGFDKAIEKLKEYENERQTK